MKSIISAALVYFLLLNTSGEKIDKVTITGMRFTERHLKA